MKITTSLPAAVQRAIDIDQLLGFICVGEGHKKEMHVLPWMCLYTSSSVFLFSIGYTSSEGDVRGVILSLLEPFEKPLLSPLAPQVVRLRAAPEISRPGAMACMLKENDGYSVVLFHGVEDGLSSVATTTPLRFSSADLLRGRSGLAVENLAYDSSSVHHIVDFCFVSFASILLLSNDGGVYGACPILFDGMCVPRSTVAQMVACLDEEIAESSNKTGVDQEARLRQCKAARHYWVDAFGLCDVGDSYYVNATVLHKKKAASQAMSWPLRLQGPMVTVSEEDESSMACQCIEPFGGGGFVEGLVVAKYDSATSSCELAFGIVPGNGAVLLPRFEFESTDDCYLIDDLVRDTGAVVERVLIKNDEQTEGHTESRSKSLISSSGNVKSCSLVNDPLDDLMVHVVTNSRIVTTTTNALSVTSSCFEARMEGKSIREANAQMSSIRTKVWSSFDSTSLSLVGAGVSNDVHLGHILVAKMLDGQSPCVIHFAMELSISQHFHFKCCHPCQVLLK
jgi:hypothetical protein